jgi:succinate-semialdehyde dehydrogenase/glutarate-semialdehyde dehydrogenase
MATALTPLETVDSINPATGEVVGRVPRTPTSAVPAILARAREVEREWAARPVRERSAQLRLLREILLARRSELAEAVVLESGKPRVEALFADIFVALDTAEFYARNTEPLLRPERIPHHSTAAKAKSGRLVYEPLGVVGIISSWNYPLAIPLSQIIPAVAAGNAVTCKTSEFTPRCGALIEKLFLDSGFPESLVTIIQGGPEIGQALIDGVPDKVFFTGSVATGRCVAQACAKHLIPSVLELGGKDAMLVLAGADLETASSAAVWGSYTNCGQVCLSVERIFVEQAVAEEFTRLCVEKTQKLRLGPGSDSQTDVGPLIRPQHVERMCDVLEDATRRGAQVLSGGKPRPSLGPNFFEPTVVARVDSSMRLFQEETFGPILAIQSVRDAPEAVARANDSPFGLAASVWAADANRGEQIARQLRAGAVMVNDAISYFAIAEAPHGGRAQSGWGRTHGKAGFLEMVQPKYIDVDRMPRTEKPWWYRYGPDLERAADSFLQFEFPPSLLGKLRHARSALHTLLRDHRLR